MIFNFSCFLVSRYMKSNKLESEEKINTKDGKRKNMLFNCCARYINMYKQRRRSLRLDGDAGKIPKSLPYAICMYVCGE
jgi:hypothetical protein